MSRRFYLFVAVLVAFLGISLLVVYMASVQLNSHKSIPDVISNLHKERPNVEHISTARLAELLESDPDLLLLDARTTEEYGISHIPGAVNVTTVADWKKLRDEKQPTQTIVYCSLGYRSANLVEEIEKADPAAKVSNVAGSIFAWASEDRPMVKGNGQSTKKVHPYNRWWGELLPPERRAKPQDEGWIK